MPEYFEISFISKKIAPKEKISDLFLTRIHLQEGENYLIHSDYALMQKKNILFHIYEYDDTDYLESTISIPEMKFYKKSFDRELEEIKKIVLACSQFYTFEFAVCSYEMNSYFITNVKTINDMDDAFLLQFPIYFNNSVKKSFGMYVNVAAQEIFVDED